MYLFSMTKKMNQFLRYHIIGEWIFSGFNISPSSFPNKYSSCGWAGKILVFAVLLLHLIGMQNPSHPVLTHILRAELLQFPAHCCSNSSQTYLIHEKFWPMSEYCLCSKTKFGSQLRTYHANNKLQLPIQAQFWCSLGSILWVVMLLLLSWKSVCTTGHCMKLWEFFMKYFQISTTLRNPASIQNFAQFVLLW